MGQERNREEGHCPLPGHAVVGRSEAKGGTKRVGLWRAGAPSRGHGHGLVVHHAAILAALGEESRDSEGLSMGRSRASETSWEAFPPDTSQGSQGPSPHSYGRQG
jgi:hypothetical protein